MSHELSGLRTLVVHDWIVPWGGAERVLTAILDVVPHADLVVGVTHPDRLSHSAVARAAHETWLATIPFARTHHRWFVPLYYAAFRGIDTAGYDLVVSSSFGFAKAVRPQPGVPHVCYCHSPPRYVWDMGAAYQSLAGAFRGTLLRLATPMLKALDRRSADGVTRFVSNSHFVSRRIRAAYGRDSTVVYPPVEPKQHQGAAPRAPREDFLLVLGRLVAYKRVDLAIQAAERLKRRIVIAGEGPERRRLEQLAGAHTTFLGAVSEARAAELLEQCSAFVFCAEEDFGIAPVEANAHGTPVIGLGRGGLTESMVEGETAVLFRAQTVDSLAAAIQRADAITWNSDRMRENARRFGVERFRREFATILRETISAERRPARG